MSTTLADVAIQCRNRLGAAGPLQTAEKQELLTRTTYYGRLLEIYAGYNWSEYPDCREKYVKYSCALVVGLKSQGYSSRAAEAARDFLLYLLDNVGFRMRPGKSKGPVLDEFVALIENDDRTGLANAVSTWFHVPRSQGPTSATLLDKTLSEYEEIAKDLIRKADEIPLTSIACAIEMDKGCIITLAPLAALEKDPGSNAVCWHTRREGKHGPVDEYFIFFMPSSQSRNLMDSRTRLDVAHELAHIYLGHKIGDYSESEECLADVVALFIIAMRGAPIAREPLSDEVLDEILSACPFLQARERDVVRRRVDVIGKEIKCGTNWDDRDREGQTFISRYPELQTRYAEEEVDVARLESDSRYKSEVAKRVEQAIERVFT
ncbi:MAG: hypothetical protein HQ582_20885 [Planctomycetes bacterium]|nr:hypothetical protein [Planctomycetota bacterium]